MPAKTKTRTTKRKTQRQASAKKAGRKRPTPKATTVARKRIGAKRKRSKKVQETDQSVDALEFSLRRPDSGAGHQTQSGDLQGLSEVEGADSESVVELLEEGNPFEAEVVSGVEAADSGEREVRTHEVPEDDVPDEYLDKD